MEKTGRKVINSAGRSVDEWRAACGGRIDSLGDNPGYFRLRPKAINSARSRRVSRCSVV